jgi:mercuric ion transport protein
MPTVTDRAGRRLTSSLTGLAAWVIAGIWMPGVAIALATLAGAAWWWTSRKRPRSGCACGAT